MYGQLVCVTAMLLGIDFGYRPRSEGGMEYLIQIEPQTLESMKNGAPLESAIPPQVHDVRAYRITVGSGVLPQILPPQTVKKPEKPRTPESEHPKREETPSHNRVPEDVPGDPLRRPRTGSGYTGDERSISPYWGGDHSGTPPQSPPRTFFQEPASRPIPEQSTTFLQSGTPSAERPAAEPKSGPTEETPRKPWVPLVLSVVLLVASATCNGYLMWLLYEGRRRYRALLERLTGEVQWENADEGRPKVESSDT